MSQGLYSRLCALNALNAVFEGKKPLDQSLDKFAKKYDLSPQDKSFAHALCGFVLRYKDSLQSLINKQANRKRDIDPPHLNIVLLMGAAQIDLMNGVADHAAVSTSVDLATHIRCSKQKGLVNAILRHLIRDQNRPPLTPSLPQWLVQTWTNDYGIGVAHDLERSSLQEAKIGLSHKNGQWRLADTHLDLSPDEWVQDYSSHMPVSLLDDLKGKYVLDLCAAPGGKTMQLAAKGAHVTALDISQKRLERLKDNLERTMLDKNVEIICADILKWKPQRSYDLVLLDAPCSATGTIRRHPDLPYIRTQRDIDALVDLQAKMLDRIKQWTNQLLYCTCSLQKAEGEMQIEKFLLSNPDFQRDGDDIRLLPSQGDRDGFFISRLKRV